MSSCISTPFRGASKIEEEKIEFRPPLPPSPTVGQSQLLANFPLGLFRKLGHVSPSFLLCLKTPADHPLLIGKKIQPLTLFFFLQDFTYSPKMVNAVKQKSNSKAYSFWLYLKFGMKQIRQE